MAKQVTPYDLVCMTARVIGKPRTNIKEIKRVLGNFYKVAPNRVVVPFPDDMSLKNAIKEFNKVPSFRVFGA